MTEKILILAPNEDVHALSVKNELEILGADVFILDTSKFPKTLRLDITEMDWTLSEKGKVISSSNNTKSIWWRRPNKHDIDVGVIDLAARQFAEQEATHAFDSIVFWEPQKVVNQVSAEFTANRKPIQLKTAREVGLKIPKTLTTNSSDSAKLFNENHFGLIFKPLTPPKSTFGETRRFDIESKRHIESINICPCIFQEEIENIYRCKNNNCWK